MKIEEIEGIGPAHAAKLGAAGVETTDHLLERAASPAGREALSGRTGHSAHVLLEWVNHVDLIVSLVPTEASVTKWIAEATTLPKVVTH